jgi:hypothetical protein
MKINLLSNTAENTRLREGRQELQTSTYTGARPLTQPLRTRLEKSKRRGIALQKITHRLISVCLIGGSATNGRTCIYAALDPPYILRSAESRMDTCSQQCMPEKPFWYCLSMSFVLDNRLMNTLQRFFKIIHRSRKRNPNITLSAAGRTGHYRDASFSQ